jgi:hypothetical protein
MKWRPLLPKGRRIIQVETGGRQPIPLAQNKVFHLSSFSTVFWILNFRVRFEALNNIFWTRHSHTVGFSVYFDEEMYIPRVDLSNELLCASNGDHIQKLRPWEVDISTTPMGPQTFWCFIFWG